MDINWYLLIPIAVGLICARVGYLWGKHSATLKWEEKYEALEKELNKCNASLADKTTKAAKANIDWENKYNALEAELKALPKESAAEIVKLTRAKREKGNTMPDKLISNISSSAINSDTILLSFDATLAKTAMGKRIKENDLTVVEGIGPKIEELFNAEDINTWKKLSETKTPRLRKILEAAGSRYKMHDPGSWPKQAKMAYAGKWKKLKEWQDIHDKGKE